MEWLLDMEKKMFRAYVSEVHHKSSHSELAGLSSLFFFLQTLDDKYIAVIVSSSRMTDSLCNLCEFLFCY